MPKRPATSLPGSDRIGQSAGPGLGPPSDTAQTCMIRNRRNSRRGGTNPDSLKLPIPCIRFRLYRLLGLIRSPRPS